MWIDAMCINQRDDQERAEQVGIMRDIYAKAFHVVIWLGKETLEDKAAFCLLDRFKDLFAKHGLVDLGPENSGAVGLPTVDEPEEWTALVKLFQRPWFQRIWVIQEATVCKLWMVFFHPSLKTRLPI
jgi:hypothetical protein